MSNKDRIASLEARVAELESVIGMLRKALASHPAPVPVPVPVLPPITPVPYYIPPVWVDPVPTWTDPITNPPYRITC